MPVLVFASNALSPATPRFALPACLPAVEERVSIGMAEVKAVFGSGARKVAGCLVSDGSLRKGAVAVIKRGKRVVHEVGGGGGGGSLPAQRLHRCGLYIAAAAASKGGVGGSFWHSTSPCMRPFKHPHPAAHALSFFATAGPPVLAASREGRRARGGGRHRVRRVGGWLQGLGGERAPRCFIYSCVAAVAGPVGRA